ncbi:MAG TPA: FtsW/RodA/SpoVE family cell cycle protein [Bryobacteraceae bacterium]|jgi:cell division protein FtsI/penicillin-binding protein 2/cell division protein FtsW (lipid II flippase)|nr:FtsW/RodA/SpoVE family cell cycle protein [Bryobacteraceae bacterium]
MNWLAGASVLVVGGLAFVYAAKTQNFPDVSERLRHGDLLNLNTVSSAGQLLPFLDVIQDQAEREADADKLFAFLRAAQSLHKPLPNVGTLARLRQNRKPLLPVSRLKPLWVVRTPGEFRNAYLTWSAIYLSGFHLVWFAWRARRFAGDSAILPALHLLSGIGLILMVSLRDPLRDTLEFRKFALGVFLGCLLLLLPLVRALDYRRLADWIYTPLLAAFALFALLLRFGTGPGSSDNKVNLGPFQPVEAIKILVVLFLAGYFARNWERLRDLRQKGLRGMGVRLGVPRLAHLMPVACAVAAAILLFFVLKDLGPALVLFFLFLTMFSVAHGRAGLAVLGIAILVAAVFVGHHFGQPRTVVERIDMWLSPWDNDVHGGNQLAHALWAFSTGGVWGSGPGYGDPGMIPAGSTDLVLPAIGEEWGFAGVATVALLFGFLIYRAFRISLRAVGDYAFFLALGLASLLAFEMLLISAGVLGALPLSGVVSPFLSSGNTAMLANFFIFALLLAISKGRPRGNAAPQGARTLFRAPMRFAGAALAACAMVLLSFAARYQVVDDREYLARDAHVFEDDGVKRAQHNPRINSIAREIPRGDIFDRNGVLLATSNWKELIDRRAQYQALGVTIDQACSRLDSRHYPFGPVTAHFLGDLRTGENFHAANASLVEHDSNARLQGYQYSELVALVRHRHRPGNPALRSLLARNRDVRTTLDIRLQMRAAEILRQHLKRANKEKGAAVVMDANSGDVLAMVSMPEAAPPVARNRPPTDDELLDRARYGQYPPGSTFKLVTAMAALRLDANSRNQTFTCRRLPDGRAGDMVEGWRRPIRDDIKDKPHGTLAMQRAIEVSCNAYFAQLGTYRVGWQALRQTADLLDIPSGDEAELKAALPFASYGQGPLLITPFKMARVAATIAAGGAMPQGRWVMDESNARQDAPRTIVAAEPARFIGGAMRLVVTDGTARQAMAETPVNLAGKTGTAQLGAGEPHAWFAGFAPYDGDAGHRIAFAVLVEHGGYGGQVAAPIAREIMEAAKNLGLVP